VANVLCTPKSKERFGAVLSLLRLIFQGYLLQAKKMETRNEESRVHTKPSLALFDILNFKHFMPVI
jgi:hypothetical protein